jgi:hypothetical protein
VRVGRTHTGLPTAVQRCNGTTGLRVLARTRAALRLYVCLEADQKQHRFFVACSAEQQHSANPLLLGVFPFFFFYFAGLPC